MLTIITIKHLFSTNILYFKAVILVFCTISYILTSFFQHYCFIILSANFKCSQVWTLNFANKVKVVQILLFGSCAFNV